MRVGVREVTIITITLLCMNTDILVQFIAVYKS